MELQITGVEVSYHELKLISTTPNLVLVNSFFTLV